MQIFSSASFHYKSYLNLDYSVPDSAWYNKHDERELRRLLADYRHVIALRLHLLARTPPFKGGEPHLDGLISWNSQVSALVAGADDWRQHLEEILLLFDEEYRRCPVFWLDRILGWTFDDWDTYNSWGKMVQEAMRISKDIQESRSLQPTFPWDEDCGSIWIPDLTLGD